MNDPQDAPQPASDDFALTVIGDALTEGIGYVIGPYKLLQQIGHGGFGVVYMAEQEKPVRRTVAIKIIKPGMDTGQVIARFESERQALALMDHPNIARVLDAGATASGRPYFVMELVKGVPITEFCDKSRLPPEKRLRLFLDACHAIQHAHHKGIIHRDIKPSNVLVTFQDGRPMVKVIDFGVAKATAQKLTERTLFTAYGQMVGTPLYMSPEQAEMSGLDIDTRSDVYSLGVLLYELLTGTTPLEAKRLREAGYVEMQRLICQEEPPRPSTRLSLLGDSATVVAGHRGLDVKRLEEALSGDLDWIVMKALEKDRDRRYDSPGNFVEDIDRYLANEPVMARPPSTAYRVKKFTQRHRAAVMTAVLVTAAVLIGAGVAVWQAQRATRAYGVALRALEGEKMAAAAEERAKEHALTREAETNAVLAFVEKRIFAAARPKGEDGGLGHAVTLRQAIESALPYVENNFRNNPLIEARLRLTLGQSFLFLGDPKRAAEQDDAARVLYARYLGPDDPRTLLAANNLASSYDALGRHTEALKLNEETLALRKSKLGPDNPATLASMENLSISYALLGRWNEALKLREETLERLKTRLGPGAPDTLRSAVNLAVSYEAAGRFDEARRLLEKSLESFKAKLGPSHPDTLMAMHHLARTYDALGRHEEALTLREKTLSLGKATLGPNHPETLMAMNNLANSFFALGRLDQALKLRGETLALRKAKLGLDHPDTLMSMCSVAQSLVAVHLDSQAVPIIDQCFELAAAKEVDPRLLQTLITLRLRSFEERKDPAGCRQTAAMWEKLDRRDPASLYLAARLRSVTAGAMRRADKSAVTNSQAAAEADRAMQWLKQAIAAGYHDAAQIQQDGDLEALRGREDFKKVVAELDHPKQKNNEDNAKP